MKRAEGQTFGSAMVMMAATLGATLGLCGWLTGCVDLPKQNATPGTASQSSPKTVPQAGQGRAGGKGTVMPPQDLTPPDRVQASALRERALQTIEVISRSEDAQARANAVEAASIAPGRLVEVIQRGLRDPSPGVRSVAAMAVGRGKLKELSGGLSALLNDPTAHVRVSAIYAMTACGQRVDRSPLAGYVMHDPSPWVRRHTAFVLGEMGEASAISLLRAALRELAPSDATAQVKSFHLQVAEAMAKLGDDGARQVLRAALYPSRPEELESAALAVQILGELKDRDSIDQLIYLAEYRDRTGQQYPAEVRLAIAGALAGVGVRQGGFIAEEFRESENPVLRSQAAYVYGQIGGRSAWTRLEEMLGDGEERVRVAAAAGVLRASGRSQE